MITVPDPTELVEKIRIAQAEKGLTINEIISCMQNKGYYPCAPATISRLLSGDTAESNYDYLKTIIPLYNTLIEDIDDNNEKIDAMKALLEYKMECIEDLKAQLDTQEQTHKEEIEAIKEKYRVRLEEETKKFQEIMDFRSHQIELKDALVTKVVNDNSKLVDHIVNCPYRGNCK